MDNGPFMTNTRTGTAGGTLLVTLLNVNFSDLLETAILAAVGAAVSYLVSVGMKRLLRKRPKIKR